MKVSNSKRPLQSDPVLIITDHTTKCDHLYKVSSLVCSPVRTSQRLHPELRACDAAQASVSMLTVNDHDRFVRAVGESLCTKNTAP